VDDTNYRIVVAYESIGLDVEETLEERLPYIRQVIAATRDGARQKQQEAGQSHKLLAGVDVIGKSREEGAKVVAQTFGALVDILESADDVYVAWNPRDEPRYVRDMFVSRRETAPPDVYALRINGLVESDGIGALGMALLGGSRGEIVQ